MKLMQLGGIVCVFGVLLLMTYYIHVTWFKVDVVLYSALLDVVLATAALAVVLFAVKGKLVLSAFESAQSMVICALLGCLFSISVPTVIDRSLSFYILEKIEQRGNGIRLAQFEDVFTKEYIREHRLLDVRLTEQKESGTIVIENGCVRLTAFGKRLTTFSRFFRTHFLPRQRLLMGEYSDDLVDPFRQDMLVVDYYC